MEEGSWSTTTLCRLRLPSLLPVADVEASVLDQEDSEETSSAVDRGAASTFDT